MAVFSLSAQNRLEGYELTEFICKKLKNSGYEFETQRLTDTGQDKFAENIVINFEPGKKDFQDEQRWNVVFDITQEDFYENQESILNFISYLSQKKLDFKAWIVFSALTRSPVSDFPVISGSEAFAAEIDNNDSFCAIAIDFNKDKKNTVYTGSLKSTSPLWLCQRTCESFIYAQTEFDFPNMISSVYRIGFIRGQSRMHEYMKSGIPAIAVNFKDAKEISPLKKFLEIYSPEGTEEWDQHYFYFPARPPLHPIYLNEHFCVLVCMILGILTLLVLCTFTFTGKKGEQNKYELLKNLYVIPLTLVFSALSLLLSQSIMKMISGNDLLNIFEGNPVLQFGFKVVFSIFLMSVVFGLHNFVKLQSDIFIYGYIISFISLFNIFLFCSTDLMFFIPFAGVYLIIYFTRRWNRLWSLILIFILMLFPFFPYAYVILKNGEIQDVSQWIFTGFFGNLSLAFGLFPFQVLWLKILVRLEIYNKNKGAGIKRILLNGSISTVSIIAFLFLIILLFSNLIYKPARNKLNHREIQFIEKDEQTLSLKINHNSFYGMTTNHIQVSSKEKPLKYSVTVYGKNEFPPVYDSIYDYNIYTETDEEKRMESEVIDFIIPEQPSKNITIDYAADSKAKAVIKVTAIYRTDDEKVFRTETATAEAGGRN